MTGTDDLVHVDELRLLEAEAVHIIREVVAELQRPVLLFSAGEGLHRPAAPGREGVPPFTVAVPGATRGHRAQLPGSHRVPGPPRSPESGTSSLVGSVQETIDSGRVADPGPGASRNRQQTRTLLDALEAGGFDAAFGGARP